MSFELRSIHTEDSVDTLDHASIITMVPLPNRVTQVQSTNSVKRMHKDLKFSRTIRFVEQQKLKRREKQAKKRLAMACRHNLLGYRCVFSTVLLCLCVAVTQHVCLFASLPTRLGHCVVL